jgi:two-component system, chemotaxis family, chemotaxis protein CheY
MSESLPIALVVDDDPVSLMLLEAWATGAGLKPVTAHEGLEAHRILLSGLRPSVIVTDIEMPVLDGIRLIDRVRQNPVLAETPVIVVSSRREPAGHRADHWLSKGESVRLTALLREAASVYV